MNRKEVSVIIVGSGISGFTVAAKLIENGFSNVTILEAENRIGGRVFTTNFSNGLIDLGAQWCHGVVGNIVHELSDSEEFAETSMDFSKMTFGRSNGSKFDSTECTTLMKLCEKIMSELDSDDVRNIDQLLTDKFNETIEGKAFDEELAAEVLNNFKKRECSYCGCDSLSQINVSGFNKFKDCKGPTWLNWKGKGYKTIFDHVLVKFLIFYCYLGTLLFKTNKIISASFKSS